MVVLVTVKVAVVDSCDGGWRWGKGEGLVVVLLVA